MPFFSQFSPFFFLVVVYCVLGFNEYAQREEKTIIKKRGKVNRRRNVCLFVCLFETERALFCRRSQRTERESVSLEEEKKKY